jgi:hypothetical protein
VVDHLHLAGRPKHGRDGDSTSLGFAHDDTALDLVNLGNARVVAVGVEPQHDAVRARLRGRWRRQLDAGNAIGSPKFDALAVPCRGPSAKRGQPWLEEEAAAEGKYRGAETMIHTWNSWSPPAKCASTSRTWSKIVDMVSGISEKGIEEGLPLQVPPVSSIEMATDAEKFRLQCHLRAPLDLAAARLKLEGGDLFLAGKDESASLLRVQMYGIATCDTEGQAVQQSTWHAVAFATRRRIAQRQGEVVLKAANDRARAWHRLTLTLGVAAERHLRDSVFGDLDRPLEEEEEEEEPEARTGASYDAFFRPTKSSTARGVDHILDDLRRDPESRAEYDPASLS